MEQLDTQMANRVWLRVQGTAQEQPLPMLVGMLYSCAAGCGRLAKHFRGQDAQLLQARSELLCQAACLQGIHRLRTGEQINTPSLPATQENAQALLLRCIGQCLRLQQSLDAQAQDREYGPVFKRMAAQTTGHIRLLLELAGK